jgi:flavin reductase (DIM6/NTAB) family NADH-FMN oxidoreductase RutF
MRKIWNRPDSAVWSLVTSDKKGTFNMNICSYVTAVSMEPKVMLVAIYKGTQTHANVRVGNLVRLQLLTEINAPLVRLLGQQSGKNIDKLARLNKRDLVAYADTMPYVRDCAGYIDAKVTKIITAGLDHDLVLIQATTQKSISDGRILTTTYLKEHKFTR